MGAPRMSAMSSCSELIASFIGLELGLNVAEPALIEVRQDFVETLRGNDAFRYASNSIGINFGCKFVTGVMEFTNRQQLSEQLLREAGNIFSFDIFISNSDRRNDKPNMLTDGEKIIIFDHELAFGFIMDLIKNPTPWIITDHEIGWIKNHYFYPALKGSEHLFDDFIDNFEVLNETFWEKLHQIIPTTWLVSYGIIKENLTSLITNKNHFKSELNRIMS